MTLYEFFARISPALGTDADTLMRYAAEDEIGGFNLDAAQSRWIVGSIWEVEGKALYAIVRALKPRRVLEIGTRHGCSATHFLSALEANGEGELTSIDIADFPGTMDETLAKRWTFVRADALEWLPKNKKHFDLIYEDGAHSFEFTRDMLAASEKAKPKLVISHDGLHFLVGADIRKAWDDVYGEGQYETALIAPSDCGFCYKFIDG